MKLLTLGIAVMVLATASQTLLRAELQEQPNDILTIAADAGTFETLTAALEAADLTNALAGEGPFTVFAPTDKAFAKLPEGTVSSLLRPENKQRLQQILKYHVVAGRATAATALGNVETLEGSTVTVQILEGRLRVNESIVLKNDIEASNGVIHVIDSVLLPAEPVPTDQPMAVTKILALAIERGVPLFNHGQETACAAIYEVAIQSILERPDGVQKEVLQELRSATDSASEARDAVRVAWILREGMDAALEHLVEAIEQGEPSEAVSVETAAEDQKMLFDFDRLEKSARWFHVNDDVMGGISTARFVPTQYGTAIFKGALSLENNGGFATVRSPGQNLALDSFDGLLLRVRGDGRIYRVSGMTSDRRMEVRTWQSEFETAAGEWQTIRVPFDQMILNVMGRKFPDAGPIEKEQLRSISFGIADKNEAPFALEIDWIQAYRAQPTS